MNKLLTALALALLCSCGTKASQTTGKQTFDADQVVVRYFHTAKRCVTCNAIEQLTRQVVDSINHPKVVLQVVDVAQNQALADRFEVSWSALILERGETVDNQTAMAFRCAKNDPQTFQTQLTQAIHQLLQ